MLPETGCPMVDDMLNNIVWNLAIPAVALYGLVKFCSVAFAYIMTLRVEGKANEWVLILNNGKLKQKGLGLHTWKGPFDSVAKFPSKVNKVTFGAETITKEMQGVKVEGMLVWTIYRNDDGPFRAYKCLGSDLRSQNPRTANENLEAKASSIVRTEIANTTIKEILRNREKLRQRIKAEMQDVQGWGIWIETIEITQVLISSTTLFRDLQSEFRQTNHYNALKMEMDTNQSIQQVRDDHEQKRADFHFETKTKYDEWFANKRVKHLEEVNRLKDEIASLENRRLDIDNEGKIEIQRMVNDHKLKEQDLRFKNTVEQIAFDAKADARQNTKAEQQWQSTKLERTHKHIDWANLEADYRLKQERAELQVIFDCVTAPVLKHQAYEMLPQCFADRKISFVCRTESDELSNFA